MNTGNLKADTDFTSRRKRRKAVEGMLSHLAVIRKAEQRYLDNVPENFLCSESFEIGENAVDVLDEVISLLSEAY